ncbi:uncharacterized [Tachysurus ichikawai]
MHSALSLNTGPINKYVQFCLQRIEECYVSARTPLHPPRPCILDISMLIQTRSCILRMKDGFLCLLFETYAVFRTALREGFTGRAPSS